MARTRERMQFPTSLSWGLSLGKGRDTARFLLGVRGWVGPHSLSEIRGESWGESCGARLLLQGELAASAEFCPSLALLTVGEPLLIRVAVGLGSC